MFGSATSHRTTERIVSVGTRSYGGIAALIKLTDKQVALLFVALRERHVIGLHESLQQVRAGQIGISEELLCSSMNESGGSNTTISTIAG